MCQAINYCRLRAAALQKLQRHTAKHYNHAAKTNRAAAKDDRRKKM